MARMSRNTFIVAAVVLAISAAAAGAWFAARLGAPELPEHARILSTPRPVPAVPGLDHEGAAFMRAELEGRPVGNAAEGRQALAWAAATLDPCVALEVELDDA
jgi:hypothetical protein